MPTRLNTEDRAEPRAPRANRGNGRGGAVGVAQVAAALVQPPSSGDRVGERVVEWTVGRARELGTGCIHDVAWLVRQRGDRVARGVTSRSRTLEPRTAHSRQARAGESRCSGLPCPLRLYAAAETIWNLGRPARRGRVDGRRHAPAWPLTSSSAPADIRSYGCRHGEVRL